MSRSSLLCLVVQMVLFSSWSFAYSQMGTNFSTCSINEVCPPSSPDCVNNVCVQLNCSRIVPQKSGSDLPAIVYSVFSVVDCHQVPVVGLSIDNFNLLENALPVSKFESSQQLVLQPRTYSVHTLLLLDLSGSVTYFLSELLNAVKTFIKTCTLQNNFIGIMGFGGNPENATVQIQPYTTNVDALLAAVDRIPTLLPKDTSTNLYGAVMEAMLDINTRIKPDASSSIFIEGIVVVFTDGTDRARVKNLQQAQSAIQGSNATTYAVSLGGEVSPTLLNVSLYIHICIIYYYCCYIISHFIRLYLFRYI
jgi:hypothetical protein